MAESSATQPLPMNGSNPGKGAGEADDGALPDRAEQLVRWLKLSERRQPLVVEVATWVGLGIIEGRLRPGADLNSVELSQRFSTSRTPVREALMILEQEGMVEMRARLRPRVAAFTLDRVREIYQVREHLLAVVARLVVERAQETQVTELGRRVTRMQHQAASGDIEGFFWSHVGLQERMTEIAGNESLKAILDSLALRTLILRHVSLEQPGRLKASADEQDRIFRAIEARDADLAAMLISRHTRAALKMIERSGWIQFAGLPQRPRRRSRDGTTGPAR